MGKSLLIQPTAFAATLKDRKLVNLIFFESAALSKNIRFYVIHDSKIACQAVAASNLAKSQVRRDAEWRDAIGQGR
jgi:hypothetical protein